MRAPKQNTEFRETPIDVGLQEFLLTVYSKHNGSPNELSLHEPKT